MGIKTSWVAIKDASYPSINAILKLSDMTALGIPQEKQLLEYHEDDRYSGRIESVLTENGWYFIICRYIPEFLRESLGELSMNSTLVMFELNETVMSSSAEYWCNGKKVWSVDHWEDAGEDLFHLDQQGELPASFDAIKEQIFARQHAEGGINADVDLVIEIPNLLVKEVMGYTYDKGFTNGDRFIEATEKFLSRKTPAQLFKKYM
jgi:hypothetical protein